MSSRCPYGNSNNWNLERSFPAVCTSCLRLIFFLSFQLFTAGQSVGRLVCQSVYRFVSLFDGMSVCLSICQSVCLYVSLSIGMSVSLSLSLFVNPLDTCKYFPIVLSKAKEQWNPKQQEIIHRISDASNGCPSVLSNWKWIDIFPRDWNYESRRSNLRWIEGLSNSRSPR